VICLGFGVWGNPGSVSRVGRVRLVLRTFPELVWKSVQNLVESIIGGMRLIRNKLTQQQSAVVVTSQVFSILYYACPVWFNPALNKKCLKTIESLHLRALRLIIRDYRQRISRAEVSEIN